MGKCRAALLMSRDDVTGEEAVVSLQCVFDAARKLWNSND